MEMLVVDWILGGDLMLRGGINGILVESMKLQNKKKLKSKVLMFA